MPPRRRPHRPRPGLRNRPGRRLAPPCGAQGHRRRPLRDHARPRPRTPPGTGVRDGRSQPVRFRSAGLRRRGVPGQFAALLPHQRTARRIPEVLPPHPGARRAAGRGDAQRRVLPRPGRTPAAPSTARFTWHGTTYRSTTALRVDRAAQLLRRTRSWTTDDGSSPVVEHSAWRLLLPQELRHFLAVHGFDVLALHDGPGPRTEPAWQPGAGTGDTADGDRLHLVARKSTGNPARTPAGDPAHPATGERP